MLRSPGNGACRRGAVRGQCRGVGGGGRGGCGAGSAGGFQPGGGGHAGPAVLLVNGDRVMSSGGAGRRDVAVAPAQAQGLAGATMGLSLGGHHYVIPSAAVPYLGHGLGWTLFDVAALATAEKAGRRPVRISYGTRLRALPGVTITRSGGGLASGYLTASSARVFGAALITPVPGGSPQRQLRPGRDVRGRRVGRPGRGRCCRDRPSGPADACPHR